MEYVIAIAWFIAGVVIGVVGTIAFVGYLCDKKTNKRKNRATNWQKVKKELDKEFHDEYGV
jgi:predicted negative regulator of RcsB-dependent stress response